MWIATLQYQDGNEKIFRLKQVIEVIRRINAKDIKLNVSEIMLYVVFVVA